MKTVDNVLCEMRYGMIPKHRHDRELLINFADRIEKAIKREREATCEKYSQVGNAAAMREALEALVGVIDKCDSGDPLWWHIGAKGVKPLKDARAALSAPLRNCDRFATAKEA